MASVAQYTRFVAFSKRSLWLLVAMVIGGIVWIVSDNNGENKARVVFSSIPQSSSNLENVMSKPHYQGVDSQNRPYTVIAERALQMDADTVVLDAVRADMGVENGKWLALNAGKGTLNLNTKQMYLEGGVDVFYDGGYEFRTEYVHVDIGGSSAYGDAPVEGQGPPGTLKAKGFRISERGQVIRFNDSVIMTLYR